MNIETLEIRRIKFDLIFLYKIFNNLVDICLQKHFKSHTASNHYNLRGHSLKLDRPSYSGSSARDTFFCGRVISLWNSLPRRVVSAPNLNSFKAELNNFDLYTVYESKIRSWCCVIVSVSCLFVLTSVLFVFLFFPFFYFILLIFIYFYLNFIFLRLSESFFLLVVFLRLNKKKI